MKDMKYCWVPSWVVKKAYKPVPLESTKENVFYKNPSVLSGYVKTAFQPCTKPERDSSKNENGPQIPVGALLFFDGWQFMRDGKKWLCWYHLFETPISMKDSDSNLRKDRFYMPFNEENLSPVEYRTQAFACYLHDYGGEMYRGYHPAEDWRGITKILPIATGRVIKKSGAGGGSVVLEHSATGFETPGMRLTSHYLHMVPVPGIMEGVVVVRNPNKQETIGSVNHHLHWEIRIDKDEASRYPRSIRRGQERVWGYYHLQKDIYEKGYICPSAFVKSGCSNGHHKRHKNHCTCKYKDVIQFGLKNIKPELPDTKINELISLIKNLKSEEIAAEWKGKLKTNLQKYYHDNPTSRAPVLFGKSLSYYFGRTIDQLTDELSVRTENW